MGNQPVQAPEVLIAGPTGRGAKMLKKLTLAFVLFALAIAGAKAHSVTLNEPSMLAGTHLKAGEYQIDLGGTNLKVVFD